MSTFLMKDDEYVRDINVIEGYMEQTAHYIHRMTGKPMEVVKEWLKKEFSKGGRLEFKPPMVDVNLRSHETGDKKRVRMNMAQIFANIRSKDLIVSPALIVYTPPHIKRSIIAQFIDENVAKRAKVKKEMFAAKAAGDKVLAANKKNEQNSFKLRNNALSGAHSSPYTILYNKSTHPSLTSTCRSATSYGNANNEKVLSGTRHYWSPGIVINNILAISKLTVMEDFQKCIDEYNLHIPTVDEVMECVHHSTKLFWKNGYGMRRIQRLVETLTDQERAAFVYIGDLYHLAKYNREVVRGLITAMIRRTDEPCKDHSAIEKRLDGDTIALVALLRADIVGSRNFAKIKEQMEKGDEEAAEHYSILLNTCGVVYDAVAEYGLLIKEILTTKNVPASIAKLPETIRRVSLVSDTDSTMATTQRWAEWYCGEGVMTGREADNVADTMVYIATQNIAHMMARMSTNMGVEKKYLHRYAMKNEYKFSSFALTNKAKHYFALQTAQEGTLFKKPELEVKGVALRTSNIPPIIMNEFRQTIVNFSTDVMNGRNIKIFPILKRLAEIERNIVKSVHNAEKTYLKTGAIKNKSAYAEPEKSSYVYHGFWKETFGPKYGESGEPDYGVVKIAVNLKNKTSIKNWLAGMKDKELAGRLARWFAKYPKRTFVQILMPEAIVRANGIPKEILEVADYRRIIFSSVEPYYHILESLGMMMIDDNRSVLVSDFVDENTQEHELDTDVEPPKQVA